MMMVELPAPPFTRQNLNSTFGFPVPMPFVAFLNALCQDCSTGEAVCGRVNVTLGWDLAGEDLLRYPGTPPELFPIAGTRADGEHYGYVIYAPELALSDYAIACYEPMHGDGVYLLGTSTFEAVETLLSADPPVSHPWWPEVSARLAELTIVPDPAKAYRNFDGDVSGKLVLPTVPEGWRHVPSSDGVGMLAPATKFNPACFHSMEDDPPNVVSILEASTRHAADGFPATALWFLRECYWHTASVYAFDDTVALCRAMSDLYRSLGRPSLASVVERRIPMWTWARKQDLPFDEIQKLLSKSRQKYSTRDQ
jgi:hypothetical protein